jgi:hypothetical protein
MLLDGLGAGSAGTKKEGVLPSSFRIASRNVQRFIFITRSTIVPPSPAPKSYHRFLRKSTLKLGTVSGRNGE